MIDVRKTQPVMKPPPHQCDGGCACGVEPLAHPKYSFGMLLEARHLELEHRYNAARMNTHDSRLHDFGTVCGLRVEKHPSPDCVNRYVILRPGIALDCCGREIVVPEDLYVPLEDGAVSGWCGAPHALQSPAATPAAPRTTLYIYLRYEQCDTDPIPSYVRACGCCTDGCEHQNCVPSVTREGYRVSVSTTPPAVWRNPIGAAFCAWLDAKLKGPGISPNGYLLVDQSLDAALCDVVTQPCADLCANGNDELLLATLIFDANDTLQTIDNCTGRRLVIPTAALFEAIACLTTAQIACCTPTDAFVALSGSVDPSTVNIEAPPAGDTLTYTVTATNTDATLAAGPFAIDLKLPPNVTFASATLAIDGVLQAAPPAAEPVAGTVTALPAGKSAVLTVVAVYDANAVHAGDVLTASAAIDAYAGPFGAAVPIATTFTDVRIDGPRVVFADLPQTLTASDFGNWLGAGIALPFTEALDPTSGIIDATSGSGDIFLELISGATVTTLPIRATWSNANALLTLNYNVAATSYNPIGVLVQQIVANPNGHWSARIRLVGGPKGAGASPAAALKTSDGRRLDGDPPQGGAPQQIAGDSGNGTQGGDFVWTVAITVPVVDGPHVAYTASRLPATLTFTGALSLFPDNGLIVRFDTEMNTTLPPAGVATGIVSLIVGTVNVPVGVTWSDSKTMVLRTSAVAMREALDTLGSNGGKITLTLAGGPKGAGASPVPAMQSTTALRLDGSPSKGTGALAAAGLSGDGNQGGDFVWTITVTD